MLSRKGSRQSRGRGLWPSFRTYGRCGVQLSDAAPKPLLAGEQGDDDTDAGEEQGVPEFVILLARAAYISDMTVSLMLDHAGEQLTNMRVFARPPNESCMICVSLWFRYGTELCFLAIASITSPRAVNDLLISMASFCVLPVASDFFSRSEPPRSHKRILPLNVSRVSLLTLVTLILNIRCDLELSMFMALAATVRCARPRAS